MIRKTLTETLIVYLPIVALIVGIFVFALTKHISYAICTVAVLMVGQSVWNLFHQGIKNLPILRGVIDGVLFITCYIILCVLPK